LQRCLSPLPRCRIETLNGIKLDVTNLPFSEPWLRDELPTSLCIVLECSALNRHGLHFAALVEILKHQSLLLLRYPWVRHQPLKGFRSHLANW
jgi:hypothetical protein